jgi:hypothetical protein
VVPLGGTSDQAPSELAYRAAMEQSSGRPLNHVQAYTGMSHELVPTAQALATGHLVVCRFHAVPALVAPEVTHVVQNERVGTAAISTSEPSSLRATEPDRGPTQRPAGRLERIFYPAIYGQPMARVCREAVRPVRLCDNLWR